MSKTLKTFINENSENGYIAMFNGKKAEIYSDSLYGAKKEAIKVLKVPKSKQGLLVVMLAQKDGKQVTHSTASL